MSFILDALRKSEMERQHDATAPVMRIPAARPKARLPIWIIALIIALSASVLVLAGSSWRQLHRPASAGQAAARSEPAPAPSEPSEAARVAPAANAEPVPAAPAEQHVRVEATQPPPAADTAVAATPAVSAVKEPPDAAGSVAKPAGGAAVADLPAAADLQAEGIALPALELQMLVNSDAPAERFVFINGARYREGQTVEGGPLVVSITPGGAVLSQRGRRFFLPLK